MSASLGRFCPLALSGGSETRAGLRPAAQHYRPATLQGIIRNPGRRAARRCLCTMASMSRATPRTVLLVQLPIPPLGPTPIRGNVPLAAAYLKLFAERKGLGHFYNIEIFPSHQANTLGDHALVEALAAREPWLVGFTCYLWNIERTLWLVRELKRRRPEVH